MNSACPIVATAAFIVWLFMPVKPPEWVTRATYGLMLAAKVLFALNLVLAFWVALLLIK